MVSAGEDQIELVGCACWCGGVLGDVNILSAPLEAGPAALPHVSVVRIQSGPEADLNGSCRPDPGWGAALKASA